MRYLWLNDSKLRDINRKSITKTAVKLSSWYRNSQLESEYSEIYGVNINMKNKPLHFYQ